MFRSKFQIYASLTFQKTTLVYRFKKRGGGHSATFLGTTHCLGCVKIVKIMNFFLYFHLIIMSSWLIVPVHCVNCLKIFSKRLLTNMENFNT